MRIPELIRRKACGQKIAMLTAYDATMARLLDEAGVDVVIVQDLGVARLAKELGVRMDMHASTQMTITSPEGVAFAARLGIKRVVIARETSSRGKSSSTKRSPFASRSSAP